MSCCKYAGKNIDADIIGVRGQRGKSAYEIAVENGYKGTEKEWVDEMAHKSRVSSLNNTALASGEIVEAVGNPVYLEDFTGYEDYNLTEPGWYIFARIRVKPGETVTEATTVEGAAGYILGVGYVDVAVRFEVAAMSQVIAINWGTESETYVFKATDLAVDALDYRVTFYVYDIDEFTRWEYALTTDTSFSADKKYYTKDGDTYTLAEVTAGTEVPADTYYNHSKVIFEGMARNITYRCNEIIDCPMEFILPEIEDETHGCWYEIRFQHAGSYSSTLTVPEGVKVATEHTQAETKGLNMVDLHYTSVAGVKVWRFMNTHSTIPA